MSHPKRSKKAWRQTDISEIEEHLEKTRTIDAQTVAAKNLKNDDLFFVDKAGNVDSRKNRVLRTGTRSSASASTAGAAATKTTVASTVPAAATAAASSAANGSAASPMDMTGDDAPAPTKKGNKRARPVQAGNTPAPAVRVKVETADMQATSTQPNGSVKSEAAAADAEEALKERARKRKLQQKKKVMLENVIKPKAMIEASRKRQKRSSTPTAAAPVAVKPEAPAWSVAPGTRPPVSRGKFQRRERALKSDTTPIVTVLDTVADPVTTVWGSAPPAGKTEPFTKPIVARKPLQVPAPGASYNPLPEEHKQVLQKAQEYHDKEKHDRLELAMRIRAKHPDQQHKPIEYDWDNDPDDELPKKKTINADDRLTKAERARRKQLEEQQREKERKKQATAAMQDVSRIGTVIREAKRAEAEAKAKKRRVADLKANTPDKKPKLGKFAIETPFPDIAMPEELAGNMRATPVTGSVLKDEFLRFQENGLIEPRKYPKKQKRKFRLKFKDARRYKDGILDVDTGTVS